MNIERRSFIKGCAAAGALLLPGIAGAAKGASAQHAAAPDTGLRVQKSIQASFGGGFSVRAHTQSGGWTYAHIEHFGTRYEVASADLLDWKIVGSA
ncbi:twin-arginine translocation signal domain-containing protein [Parapusillimonas granuli]|uniref:Twin-arginine translocation signal domain-containing protein n=1 Tax=Parapusillimonas granuli TaxID=380911 RepID=A0A853FX16_9BURK|nr:twin-arginine translocation signal domain-containing protein [Parapusillimonas granuli]MBB5213814.1 anaerobic selenocysteine-containing dehydrogenase [Parapusillimonas granuli]MEB2398893.1 twin-arginine translocation signal domain-containing protein [Alcaligenaceae bacterium]NYT48649.1 twin-arginine translocation signal domain-containing protein [Parapusillimonas granuli]